MRCCFWLNLTFDLTLHKSCLNFWLKSEIRLKSETAPHPWAPSQYPKKCLSVRSRKVSKPRDLYLELSDCSEIWQALRQQCCRCACQISKRYDNLKYQSRGFETLRDLTKRRLFGYWDGALVPGVFYGVHFGWPIHDFHVLVLHEIPSASGCVGQNIILDQNKAVLEGGSCPQ